MGRTDVCSTFGPLLSCPRREEGAGPEGRKRERKIILKAIRAWNQISLVKRILMGLVVGVILGLACPGFTALTLLGNLFVGALKALAPLLVFALVVNALAHHKQGQKSNMGMVVLLYLLGTFAASLCAVTASFLFPSTLVLAEGAEAAAPGGIWEVMSTLLLNAVSNPLTSMMEANYVGVLTWAVIFGLAMRAASDTTRALLSDIADALSVSIRWVINMAPFGIMGDRKSVV